VTFEQSRLKAIASLKNFFVLLHFDQASHDIQRYHSTFQDPKDEKAVTVYNELFNLIAGKLKENIIYCTLHNTLLKRPLL